MIRRVCWLLLILLAGCAHAAAAPPPDRVATLKRGVNVTGWFRYPASRDPAALRSWMSDAAIGDLHAAGFTFVRLAVDPALLDEPPIRRALVETIHRLQHGGLGVVVSPHPSGWHLETEPKDRAQLHTLWTILARELRPFDPALTFPEILNEPVFPGDPAGWQALQHSVLKDIRASLPNSTVVLTGHDWGSIGGLLALPNVPDTNAVYSFHFYDPVDLTSLAAWRPGLDRAAMARLPFPVKDMAGCYATSEHATDAPTHDTMRYYCEQGWDLSRLAARIARAAEWADRHQTVLLAGEFGASAMLNRPARLAWLRGVRESFEANAIGWALWGYDDIMGLSVARPPARRPVLDPDVLTALGLQWHR